MKVETFEQVEAGESQGSRPFVCAAVLTAAPIAVIEGNSSILQTTSFRLMPAPEVPARAPAPSQPALPASASSCPGPPCPALRSVWPQAGPFAWMLGSWASPAQASACAPAAASLGEEAHPSSVQTRLWLRPGPYVLNSRGRFCLSSRSSRSAGFTFYCFLGKPQTMGIRPRDNTTAFSSGSGVAESGADFVPYTGDSVHAMLCLEWDL